MKQKPEELLDKAMGALQPFYDEGDDGSPIRLSLDAIAGLLVTYAEATDETSLAAALDELGADSELIDGVVALYDAARGGEYGAGLYEDQVKAVNDQVQDLYDPLTMFVLKHIRPKRKNPAKRRRQGKRKSR